MLAERPFDPDPLAKWTKPDDKTESLAKTDQSDPSVFDLIKGSWELLPSKTYSPVRTMFTRTAPRSSRSSRAAATAKTRARGGLVTSHVRGNYAGPASYLSSNGSWVAGITLSPP